jgi:proteasome assembly chaperone (PAC2) family protein
MSSLISSESPELRKPKVVAGFSGWANAGEVSSGAVSYLKSKLNPIKYAELDPEPFYDFTNARPYGVIAEGVIKSLKFTSNEFFYWENSAGEHDLILFLGTEPHLRWRQFAEDFFAAFQESDPDELILLGSFYDSTPHTRDPVVSAAVNDSAMRDTLSEFDLQFTDYEGPTSIHSVLEHACIELGIPSISLWTGTPHYLPTANPRAWRAVLDKLLPILGIDLDLQDLRRRGDRLNKQVEQALSQNPKLRKYVRQLESALQVKEEEEPLQSDDIIKSLEDFLRERQQGEPES